MAGALLEKSGAVGALHVPQKSGWGTSCAPKIISAPQSAPDFSGGKPSFPALMGHWGTSFKEFSKTSKKGK